ncbi:TIGR01841 family phasin [Spectribacter hydrogenoxidans]|uniref:TIGR01841 family phasin n=1 Tax=Spectribacter hydrogenoxidans TaxID=3075608 RepID=A0ABU3C0S2_9GAMM|nr:TIGR01841 family phasin [Salinisphaera sp. W335]MDT0635161.1 TIGR01841 family phasin [Salinisphaera sp. W335]
MAKKESRATQLRKEVDKLRKSYTKAMTSTNKAVFDGIERLAEHELNAIKKHYEEALKNIKSLRKGGDPRDIATSQLRLMQDTIDRILANARESLQILDKTRQQINEEIRKSLNDTGQAATGAKKVATGKTTAKSTAAKSTGTRRSTAKTTKPTARKSGTTAKRSTATSKAGSTARKSPSTAKRSTTARKPAARKTTTARKSTTARKTSAASKSGSGSSGTKSTS